jgi:hypothetical protein
MLRLSDFPTRSVAGFNAIGALALAASLGCSAAAPRSDPAANSPAQAGAKPATHPPAAPDARDALEAFVTSADKGDFTTCWRSLAAPLRERYTPARLADDFAQARGLAEDKLARARAAMASAPRLQEGRAEFPVSERKAVRLVLEADGWKIAALE